LEVTPPGVRQPLVDLTGAAVSARYYQLGNSSMLAFDNPLTAGDDEKLMDSMILSANNPVDGCFWIEGLSLGLYEVTIYALTPNDPSLLNRVRVDFATPDAVMVGGTWPGRHRSPATFARFTVTTTDGKIIFHHGLFGGVFQSGINGVQLEFLPPGAARALTYGIGCYAPVPLTLSASARPVLGTTIGLVTANIPATAQVSVSFLGVTQYDPGFDLASVGMPRCFLHVEPVMTLPLSGTGTRSTPLPLPSDQSLLGARAYSQSASLVAGVNLFGALTSNGTTLQLGSQ
jgi:hypothetical protein